MSSCRFDLSSRRSTIFSPKIVGSTETRKSMSWPGPNLSLMRPSCGRRRSAMSSCAMTLMREVMAFFSFSGGFMISSSTPSTRKRTRNIFSNGSRWMSLARRLMALVRMALTSRTTGASSVARSSSLRSTSSSSLDELDVVVLDLREHVVVVGALVVELLDRRADRAGGGDRDLDVVAGEELDLVDGDQVRRVGHRQRQRRAAQADRYQVVAPHQRRRAPGAGPRRARPSPPGRPAAGGTPSAGTRSARPR